MLVLLAKKPLLSLAKSKHIHARKAKVVAQLAGDVSPSPAHTPLEKSTSRCGRANK